MNYKNRISLRLILASAMIVMIAFFIIYGGAYWTVLESVDQNLSKEAKEHLDQISIVDQEVRFIHKGEWEEREHQEMQFNPIFIQIVDNNGKPLDKSPNLGSNNLFFKPAFSNPYKGYNLKFNQIEVRQMQIALQSEIENVGYLLIATSFKNESHLLKNLQKILFILFPFILISLFLILRFLAGKSIQPILDITEKAKAITQQNLNQRIPQPSQQDEINDLSIAINDLLERLENAMIREQQFTSDASHELRTPLAVLKGNFEVLIRKPRTPEEYVSKIKSGLETIDRLNEILDQLLVLARIQKGKTELFEVDLSYLIKDTVLHIEEEHKNRQIKVENQFELPIYIKSNEKALSIIFHNLIENALKYSPEDTVVNINLKASERGIEVEIQDKGIGIEKTQISKIFNPFFRGKSHSLGKVAGAGLGLSIVKKLCDDLQIDVEVNSRESYGTTFTLFFPKTILQS